MPDNLALDAELAPNEKEFVFHQTFNSKDDAIAGINTMLVYNYIAAHLKSEVQRVEVRPGGQILVHVAFLKGQSMLQVMAVYPRGAA